MSEPTVPTYVLPKRSDEDLDSASVGSDSTVKGKFYFNVRKDSEEEIARLAALTAYGVQQLKSKMETAGLVKEKKLP
jgi:hypothetical protein